MRKRRIGEPEAETAADRQMVRRGGRQTRPRYSSVFGMLPYSYIPRRLYEHYDIGKLEHSRLTASALLSLLPDLNPDIGLAVWNMLRLGSAGFDYTVQDATGNDDQAGKELLDRLVERINERSGGLNGLIVQWLMSGFLQGAVSGEVALTEDLRDVDDFHAVDPHTINFGRDEDQKLVAKHRPPSGGAEVVLNPETFWYIPIDPVIDDPYGRPPAAPVLQEVWFDIALILDLRKAIRQGWWHVDIKVIEEAVRNAAPEYIQNEPEKLREWLNARLDDIGAAYDELDADDTFAHYDSVEIQTAAGAPSGSVVNVDRVIRAIERRMIKALKQLPILMASNEGVTETHGSVQWQIFVAGLRSLQQAIEDILSGMMQLALEVYGHPGRVECWFEKIRTTDRASDANAEKVEIDNAIRKWQAGFQTWEESAIEVTGSPPPEGAEPPDPTMFGGLAIGQLSAAGATRLDGYDDRLDREIKEMFEEEEE